MGCTTCISDRIVFCSGIRRECDGGTAWERVEMGDCPLTPPSEDIQVKLFQVGVSIHWTDRFATKNQFYAL